MTTSKLVSRYLFIIKTKKTGLSKFGLSVSMQPARFWLSFHYELGLFLHGSGNGIDKLLPII